jgi:hypothetical protein
MSLSGPSKENTLADIINPYMRELKMHPKELSLKDGELQIEDVQGPKGEGSLEARMERWNKKFLNIRRWRNARWTSSIGLIKSLSPSTRKRLQNSGGTSFRSMRPLTNYKHNSTTCRTKIVSMKLGFNK